MAIARKLLVIVWHVLTKQVADQHAIAEHVARKLMRWAWMLGTTGRQGDKAGVFVRRALFQLGIGASITALYKGKLTYAIPPPEAVST